MQKLPILSIIVGVSLMIFLPLNSTNAQELNSHPEDRKIESEIHPALVTKHIRFENKQTSNENVDYNGFLNLAIELRSYRQERLLSLENFAAMLQEKGVLLLDTRSKIAYDNIHIKGAVHLNFSDFTTDKLAEIIPSKDTPVLIYCNNNFINSGIYLASKMAPLALNIPTFINLYGYGYENIYELEPALDLNQIKEHLDIEKQIRP